MSLTFLIFLIHLLMNLKALYDTFRQLSYCIHTRQRYIDVAGLPLLRSYLLHISPLRFKSHVTIRACIRHGKSALASRPWQMLVRPFSAASQTEHTRENTHKI
ncbi:hypothetical protein BGX38DRAFT_1232650 [Terfezia claveryi]|nr:hypothetical protein BGX38DRAFT_1232650 [Terfezia claveryi]